MFFGSDNTSPAHPKVLEALTAANEGYASPYATDRWTEELTERLRDLFQAPDALVYPMTSGTGTNAALLAAMSPPWGVAYCHETAHIEVDERGAATFYGAGLKLKALPAADSRIAPEALVAAIATDKAGHGVHAMVPSAVSVTNLTEFGEAYTPAQLGALADASRLPMHLDGARFSNALVATGVSPWEMTRELSTLSLGATKNGGMAAEAAVLFDPALQEAFESHRMRGGHNLSKARYVSAQILAWLENDLWLELAAQSNAMAARLAKGLSEVGGELAYNPDGNMIFARLPRAMHAKALGKGAVYNLWGTDTSLIGDPETPLLARFVASWSTTEADVDALLAAFAD
ncbi:threonine aldolase family protein [Celeribacter litoreus]|uniref:threonine aldolase family protein n=1 Tax=Celeribacter litoreus TaxID=2876714 RepID=UPI001CCB7C63|nr:beta-eliminating lyase-related protein [Celeribacter litoreus]MCA0042764.1 low specificity L-threonine aldolase [Celeribacter litoreus]